MLTTVKKALKEIPDTDFREYFQRFIFSVQDSNIEAELHFLLKYNQLNTDMMQNLIQNTYERLEFLHDKNSVGIAESLQQTLCGIP